MAFTRSLYCVCQKKIFLDVGFEAIKGAGSSQQLSTACDLVDKRIEDSFGFILVENAVHRCSVLLYTQKLEGLEVSG